MAQQTINIGSAPEDFTGDSVLVAMDKINDNFTELYARSAPAEANTYFRRKTSFTQRISNGTNTPTADPELAITSVPAGTYIVEVSLYWSPGSNAFKFGINSTGSVTLGCGIAFSHRQLNGAMDALAGQMPVTGTSQTCSSAEGGLNGAVVARGRGLLVTSGTGTVSVFWHCNAGSGNSTNLNPGSYLRLYPV